MDNIVLSVSEFVEVFNQTLAAAYPVVNIIGELANLRVSRGKWIYFDLKDEYSYIKFFGTVYNLPGPLEDGMLLNVKAFPKLHNQYGFNLSVISIALSGEGTIKKAAQLLQKKLTSEGIFAESRKRQLPYPPEHITLITSKQSAAYSDFIKIVNARWTNITVDFIDVQVQGEAAVEQIVKAIDHVNESSTSTEILVVIRGGGGAEDLAAFNSEQITRAIASSRIPTLVAVGHERDISLAELAADKRASTPSNAAEMLVPDKKHIFESVYATNRILQNLLTDSYSRSLESSIQRQTKLNELAVSHINRAKHEINLKQVIINALNPNEILKRGYAVVRDKANKTIRNTTQVKIKDIVKVQLYEGKFKASVGEIES